MNGSAWNSTAERTRLYPPNWREVSAAIKARAQGCCECEGECGLHRTRPGPRRCIERHGKQALWARGNVMLTVHHLNHDPTDNRPENLKAMCQRCHLRCDVTLHQENAARTRRRKKRIVEMFP
jgi:hypothetical protein